MIRRGSVQLPKKLAVDNTSVAPSRLGFINSTARCICPPIPIQHGTGQHRFYQCSNCGYIASRIRKDWHVSKPCIENNISFTHDYKLKQAQSSVFYHDLIDYLFNKDEPIKDWQKQKLKQEYSTFIPDYNYNRSNPDHKELIRQVSNARLESQKLSRHMHGQNQKLDSLLDRHRKLASQVKVQGCEIPSETLQRQRDIDEVIEILDPTWKIQMRALLHKHFYGKKADPEMKQYAVKYLQQEIFKIDLIDSYSSWKQDVNRALVDKIKGTENNLDPLSRKREQNRQKKAANFLKRINYSVLRNKRLFIEVLKQQSKKIQIAAISFLNYMRNVGCEVPQVSNKIIKRSLKKAKRGVSIHELKNKVIQLKADNQLPLACDLFFAFCMSVRLNDLTRIVLRRGETKTYYDYISITEMKNKHETVRVVPIALKKLVSLSNNSYPITKERLLQLKDYCHEKFQGFYLLRAASITSILSGLMKASGFSPHHVSSTTLRYYVDYQDYDLIDNIFDLQISGVPQSHYKRTYARLHIGKLGDKIKQFSCDRQNPVKAQINFPSTMNPRKEEAIDNLQSTCIFEQKLSNYQTKSIKHLNSKKDLARFVLSEANCNYLETIMISNFSFLKLLASMINSLIVVFYDGQENIFHPSSQYLNKAQNKAAYVLETIQKDQCSTFYEIINQEPRISEEIQKLNESFEQHLNQAQFSEFQQIQTPSILKDNSKRILPNDVQQAKLVLVLGGKQDMQEFVVLKHNEDKKEATQKQRRKSQRLLKAEQCTKMILKKSQTCQLQCSSNLDTVYCLNCSSMRTVCDCCPNSAECSCQKHLQVDFKLSFQADSYFINTKYTIIDETYNKRLIDLKFNNNLKKQVEKSGRRYLTKMASSLSLKLKMYLPWQIVTKQIAQQIKYMLNYQNHLPLKIVHISKEKGQGIIATSDIDVGTIIGAYFGVIKSSKQADPNDDSLVSIGWYRREEYFICCKDASNFGRFFNGAESKQQANCILKIAIIDDIGFCPYFVTKHNILEGEELDWYYGKKYTYQ